MSLLKFLIRQELEKLVDKESNVIKGSEHNYGHDISEESIRLMCSLLTKERRYLNMDEFNDWVAESQAHKSNVVGMNALIK